MSHAVLKAIADGDQALVLSSLTSQDAASRAFAANGIGQLGLTQATGDLLRLFRDPNWIVRAAAAAATGRLGLTDEPLIQGLVEALGDDEPTVVRLSVQALGKLGSDAAIDELISVVRHGESRLSGEAIKALGQIGDARATEALIEALQGPFFGEAIQSLGMIGDPRALAPLIETFTAGVNAFVEWYIVAALRDIGAFDDVFRALATHDAPETRAMLCRVVREWWPDKNAVQALIRAMDDESAVVRYAASYGLRNYNLPDELQEPVKEVLQKGLQDESADVRHWCQQNLENWDS